MAGRSYRINLKGNASTDYGGTLGEPQMILLDDNGGYLQNDTHIEQLSGTQISGSGVSALDGGAGDNARMEVRAHTGGRYYIAAYSENEFLVGSYTLVVTDITN